MVQDNTTNDMGDQEVRIYDPLEIFSIPRLNSGENGIASQAIPGTDIPVKWEILSFVTVPEEQVPQFGENIVSVSKSARGSNSPNEPTGQLLDDLSKSYVSLSGSENAAQRPEGPN